MKGYMNELQKKYQYDKSAKISYIIDEFMYLTRGIDSESQKIMNDVLRRILIAINCNLQDKSVSPFGRSVSIEYSKEIRSVRSHYKVSYYFPEVFYSHHGLRFANKKIIEYVSNRDILDIGAFCGDSLTVLLSYTKKKVCSIEYSPENMKLLNNTIEDNNLDRSRIIVLNKGIGNESRIIRTSFAQSSGSTITENDEGALIEITTVDKIVNENHLTVGFMKADIEGMELQALQGAVKTILKDRPVISFSIYHNFDGLFGLRKYIEQFPNYTFQYGVGSPDVNTFGELIIFAYPTELSE